LSPVDSRDNEAIAAPSARAARAATETRFGNVVATAVTVIGARRRWAKMAAAAARRKARRLMSLIDVVRGIRRGLAVCVLFASALPIVCDRDEPTPQPLEHEGLGPDTASKAIDPMDIGAGYVDSPPLPPLVDRPGVYAAADYGPVEVSVTVLDDKAFAAVQANTPDARAPIVFAATDHGAARSAHGTIELRGSTSRTAIQKSYQIKLDADAGAWRGSRVINLLKHPFDLTRVRNALSFEYFRRITDINSMRTGWVHLFIDSVDQGLYEWIEEPDEAFFAAHGLDPGGTLYKARSFTFEPIDNRTASDPDKLDAIIAQKGTPDLAKLRRMIAAVNDDQQPIDEVLAHYFNRENYVTWLAVNVLMSDFDSISQNFMLYSPPGFEGWYLLPWDYDVAWGWSDQPGAPLRPRWREGIANWWRVVLHQRFLAEPGNLAELDARIVELAATINDANTAAIMGRYHDLVRSFVSRRPDINDLPADKQGTPEAVWFWDAEYSRVAGNASRAFEEYTTTDDRPMPYWLYVPRLPSPGSVRFSWSPSFQLHGAPISYDIEINASENFERASVLATATGLIEPGFTITTLPPGRHFWRVVARAATDPNRHWQAAHNGHLFVDVP